MPTINSNNLTLTATTRDGVVIPFDTVLAQNIGRVEISSLRFTVTAPEGTFFSAVLALGPTNFDPVSGPFDNVAQFDGRGLRETGALEFTGNFSVRLIVLNADGTPATDENGFIRETVTFPINVLNDLDGGAVARNPAIVLGEGPAPVDPAPIDPAPVDPAPVNVINGTNRGDRIEGTAQADEISGNRGNDVLNGRGGDDNIDGGAGRDDIRGGGGDDTLDGGGARDVIRGGAGDDTIDGGRGNDVLFGNRGADTFVFATNSGDDVIRDFGARDQIDLSGVAGFNSLDDVAAALTQTRRGTEIDLGDGNSVLLRDVAVTSLDADDFLL